MKISFIKHNENKDNKKCCGQVMSEVQIGEESFKFCSCCGDILLYCSYGENYNRYHSEMHEYYQFEAQEMRFHIDHLKVPEDMYYYSIEQYSSNQEDPDNEKFEDAIQKRFDDLFGGNLENLKPFLLKNLDYYKSLNDLKVA